MKKALVALLLPRLFAAWDFHRAILVKVNGFAYMGCSARAGADHRVGIFAQEAGYRAPL